MFDEPLEINEEDRKILEADAADYVDAAAVALDSIEIYRPPRRMTPTDAATRYLRNEKGAYDPELAPMMREPLDMLASRAYTGIVFIGPARLSKTFSLIHGGVTYITKCAPGDTMIMQMSKDTARDFSRTELDRVIRNSPALKELLSPAGNDDNTFDKTFTNGMALKLGWPAISQLSSKTLQYVFVTDYDRPENRDDVDGEGSIWDLISKRIETYMSRGKCLAESSPGEELLDYGWRAKTPHEAPPVAGLLGIYNRGTRARWMWPCIHCGTYFQAKPGLDNFSLPAFEELEKIVTKTDLMLLAEEHAHIACPTCGGVHSMEHRRGLSIAGHWLHEGEKIDDQGRITGSRRRTNIVSYWCGGVAATFQRWDAMLLAYFQSIASYVRTGDETAIKATVLKDQAAPYVSRAATRKRSVEDLVNRKESWLRGHVPDGVKFLTAQVDVQGNRFVVQVNGWGVQFESWIIDRFNISVSRRVVGDRLQSLAPASYMDDWHILIDEVILKAYPLERDPTKYMPVRLTVNDSGGTAGVTANAYDFWRHCRNHQLHTRYQLVKGDHPRNNAPRAQLRWPDIPDSKLGKSAARGDIPLWFLNTNILKDAVAGNLLRTDPGPGYIHLPDWLDDDTIEEFTVEVRGEDGWSKKRNQANESFDLQYYGRAACIIIGAEKINWERPPPWFESQLIDVPEGMELKQVILKRDGGGDGQTMEDLGRQMGAQGAATSPREPQGKTTEDELEELGRLFSGG